MAKAIAAVAFVVSLVGSPIAALHCEDTGPAAMACCTNDAGRCNEPGMTDECCQKAPADERVAAGPAKVTAAKPGWTSVPNPDALLPAAFRKGPANSALTPWLAARVGRADFRSPPLSVLRI